MHRAVTEESICKANALFWEQMLAMRLEPILEPVPEPVPEPVGAGETGSGKEISNEISSGERCIGPEHVVAGCGMSGEWVGQIEVRLSRGLALEATAAMLMQPIADVQPGDTLDAIREIANMIAGTLKSALPRPCIMTVPWAEAIPGSFCIRPRTENSVSVLFRHSSGELMVRVWESRPASSSAEIERQAA